MGNHCCVHCGVVVALCVLSLQAVAGERVFLVPQGVDASLFPSGRTQISAAPGDQVCLDIYLNSSPANVTAAQPVVPGSGTGGTAGSLTIDCSTVFINASHPAYPPGPGDIINATRTVECPDEFAAYAVLTLDIAPMTIPAGGAYLGEVCYDLSADAAGTFAVDFVTTPGPFTTDLLDPGSQSIPSFVIDGADISTVPMPACCLPDGTCEQLTASQCAASAGVQTGQEFCGVVSCLGACCVDGVCNDPTPRAQCLVAQGVFQGEGTTCDAIVCSCVSAADCDDGNPCTTDACRDGECVNCDRHAADVNSDCVINIFDLFCVLKGFNDDFSCDQACP